MFVVSFGFSFGQKINRTAPITWYKIPTNRFFFCKPTEPNQTDLIQFGSIGFWFSVAHTTPISCHCLPFHHSHIDIHNKTPKPNKKIPNTQWINSQIKSKIINIIAQIRIMCSHIKTSTENKSYKSKVQILNNKEKRKT